MITGMVKQAFHAAVQEDFAPTAVLERISAASRIFPDGKYITATVVRFGPASLELEYASAGHPPGLLLGHLGSVVTLEPSAPIIIPHCLNGTANSGSCAWSRGTASALHGWTAEAQNGDGDGSVSSGWWRSPISADDRGREARTCSRRLREGFAPSRTDPSTMT
jgi:hypothetical protein